MDNRSWQSKKMKNDSTQVFRIDRPLLKDLLFPLIKAANSYCHNYIRNNGRNNNGQQKFATEEDEKRFDPLSTVSSNYLLFLLLLSFHNLSFPFTKAPIARVRFFLASDSYPIDPSYGPGRAHILISPRQVEVFLKPPAAALSRLASWLTLYTYI